MTNKPQKHGSLMRKLHKVYSILTLQMKSKNIVPNEYVILLQVVILENYLTPYHGSNIFNTSFQICQSHDFHSIYFKRETVLVDHMWEVFMGKL